MFWYVLCNENCIIDTMYDHVDVSFGLSKGGSVITEFKAIMNYETQAVVQPEF
jgi:hypothetical protein